MACSTVDEVTELDAAVPALISGVAKRLVVQWWIVVVCAAPVAPDAAGWLARFSRWLGSMAKMAL